ncbi:hypothetical protein Ancab_009635 [Ancistrocladus abbreviatus]
MGCKPVEKPKQKSKPKHRKGLWSPEEDERLRNYVLQHGHGCWSSVPINSGLKRNGKSCRLRWINYLRPGLKRGMFTPQEEEAILNLHRALGNKWAQIAMHLPGRTDNEIKNFWHSYLKKRLPKPEQMETRFTIRDSENNINSESPPKSITTSMSSFESLEYGEGSSTPSNQSVLQSNELGQKSSLPKLLFAEWLNIPDQNNLSSVEAEHLNPFYSTHAFGFQDSCFELGGFMPELATYNEGSSSSGSIGSELFHGTDEDMLHSQLKFEDQTTGNIGLAELLSEEELCSSEFFMLGSQVSI